MYAEVSTDGEAPKETPERKCTEEGPLKLKWQEKIGTPYDIFEIKVFYGGNVVRLESNSYSKIGYWKKKERLLFEKI